MLTDTRIIAAKPQEKAYRLPDGGALFLEVKPSGIKSWLYRYRLNGKQGVYVIGRYYDAREKPADHITIKEARQKRDAAHALVKQGLNPALERKKDRLQQHIEAGNTFRAVAKLWIEDNRPHWSLRYVTKVERSLEREAYAHIGDIPLRDLRAAHILDVINRVKAKGYMSVAIEIQQWCSAIFCYAIPRQLAEVDHAAPLKRIVKRPPVKHKNYMAEDDIKDFLSRVDHHAGRKITIALKLLMYVFTRPINIQAAEWTEFNFHTGDWVIPAEKMKMRRVHAGRQHITPLPRQALALLAELKTITGRGRYLFPNDRDSTKHINETSLNKAMVRMGYEGKFSPHSFRATAKTLLRKYGYGREITEIQLGHAKGQVEASYDFYEHYPERKAMMQRYANLIEQWSKGITVIEAGNAA